MTEQITYEDEQWVDKMMKVIENAPHVPDDHPIAKNGDKVRSKWSKREAEVVHVDKEKIVIRMPNSATPYMSHSQFITNWRIL